MKVYAMLILRSVAKQFCHVNSSPSCIVSSYCRSLLPKRSYCSNMGKVKKRYDSIVKSSEDKRDYRGIELSNGMRVILVSDPTTDKSAAALCVNIGFMSDPDYLPGLAHLCEHMLFLGTKKYPLENEYSKYLSEHGGGSNAHTSSEHTCYYFDVKPENLDGALDRFAQFFIAPLFTENVTDREINSVDSEHEKNIQNDSWRLNQLERSISKPGHPYTKFGTGNRLTLDTIPKEKGINVRNELLAFHEKWYSANIMTLAVLGKENLDELEELIVPLFSTVINKNIEVPEWKEPPLSKNELMLKGYVVPIKDVRSLAVTFLIPDYKQYYKAAPGHYLSHLIGHEGPGSLLSVLKARSWCNSLLGGPRGSNKGFDFFSINVDLTPDGIDHVDDIIHLIFQYINMLKQQGPQKWIFEEYAELFNMHFRFKDKQSPRSFVNGLTIKLLDYEMEDVLAGGYKITEWRPDMINELLEHLCPENTRSVIVAKKFQPVADQKESWYGTQYKLESISNDVIEKWKDGSICNELHMPERNEFIPTNFDLFPRDENANMYPVIIQETPYSRVWYKQDNDYLLPKVNMSFEFISPLAYLDPVSCNLTYMFVMLFKDALMEYAYAAELAGLRWELTNTKYGMVLGIGGYNHKQKILLEKIMEKMTNFEIDPKRFEILKENYIRGLKNFEIEQPYQHANYYLAVLLAEQSWTKSELLAATEFVTVESVSTFIKQLLSKMHVESLVHGNTTKEVALDMVNTVMDRLSGSVGL
ncbi:unnamed protein product [Nezara viridula]|uniref:Insulin-degrading enzyme n=1 Tax=Nezara viridula TaxID=85310 RepID=A0A9P0E3V3_NEZVI|nr:unnamed protein product [Nezara viridula]